MKVLKIIVTVFVGLAIVVMASSAALAQTDTKKESPAGKSCVTAEGKQGATNEKGACTVPNVCGSLPEALCQVIVSETANADNPLGGLKPLLDAIVNILIGLFGIFAVFVLVISGVQISASAGNESALKSAKENIFKVVTGLVLLISFRAIISLINNLFKGVDTGKLFCPVGNSVELCSTGVPAILGNAISVASFFAGVVAVIFIIIGGIRYTTSVGSPKALENAKKTLIYAIAGLVLSMSAYAILIFIQTQLTR